MLRDRGLRQTSPELTTESLLRGAHASAVLEGSASSLDEVRAGAGDDIAQGALRVSVELLGLVPVFARSPAQALARLHALAAPDSVPDDERGRPRDAASAARLRASLRILDSHRPALITAALLHAELVCGAPFARRERDRRACRRAAGAGQQRRRRQVAGGARGRPPRPARGVRVEPAGLRRGRAPGAAWRGCSTAPRRTPRGPRRARCATGVPDRGPGRGPHVRAAPDRSGAAADTRTRLPSVLVPMAAPEVFR